jgi:hypothetical protein
VPFVLHALSRGKIGSFLTEAHSAASNQPNDNKALKNLEQICRGIAFGHINYKDDSIELRVSVLHIAFEFGYVEVLAQCLKRLGDRISGSIGSDFGKTILSLGFPKL